MTNCVSQPDNKKSAGDLASRRIHAASRRIALVLNDNFSMLQFRGDLIAHLVACGEHVTVIVPPGKQTEQLRKLGAEVIIVPMKRFIAPLADFVLFLRFLWIFLRGRFDIVHTMTVKPNIYGGLAARFARVPRVVGLISGAGQLFSAQQPRTAFHRLSYRIGRSLYFLALRCMHRIWFQNLDDRQEFVDAGLAHQNRTVVIRGSGINTTMYAPEAIDPAWRIAMCDEFEIPQGVCIVTMVARLIWAKGIREFIESSKIVAAANPSVFFLMVAPREAGDPDAVPDEYLEASRHANLRLYTHSWRNDTRSILASADIVVLDSFYREGVPRTLLEAMALGKPLITSASVGCRETVDNEINGIVIPPRDPHALAAAVLRLAGDLNARRTMGCASRQKALREFSSETHCRRVVSSLYDYA